MEELNNNNASLGAKIIKDGKPYFIYKVNDKSFYYGEKTFAEINSKWKNKSKDTTWKIFMEQNNGKQTEYKGFQINKVDIVAKEATATKTKKKGLLSVLAEKELLKLYDRYLKGSGKSYKHIVDIGSKSFKIVEANENNQVLLSIDGNFVFYDLQQDKYIKWREVKMGGPSMIPWPRKTENPLIGGN